MDSEIKLKVKSLKFKGLALCAMVLFGLSSCKENNWMDWKVQNELWLKQNALRDSVVSLPSGLQYKVITDPGAKNGEAVPNPVGSTIVCDYSVRLINGYYIQKDVHNATLQLSTTIPGFAEGCHHIHNHGDIELYIPAYLGYDYEKYRTGTYVEAEGYGTEGTQGYIPPFSTLIYTIHLCGISGN